MHNKAVAVAAREAPAVNDGDVTDVTDGMTADTRPTVVSQGHKEKKMRHVVESKLPGELQCLPFLGERIALLLTIVVFQSFATTTLNPASHIPSHICAVSSVKRRKSWQEVGSRR